MAQINKDEFFKKFALGGVIIVLPIAILAMGIRWLFRLVTDLIQPFTDLVVTQLGLPELAGDVTVPNYHGSVMLSGWVYCHNKRWRIPTHLF